MGPRSLVLGEWSQVKGSRSRFPRMGPRPWVPDPGFHFCGMSLLTIFAKKFRRWCSTGLKIGFEILNSLLFPLYKSSRENTQPENKRDIVFEMVKGRAGKINRTSLYVEAEVRIEGFFKKGVMRNFAKFTKKTICAGISFLIRLNSNCKSATSLKMSLSCRCFLVKFPKFVGISFCRRTPDDCF